MSSFLTPSTVMGSAGICYLALFLVSGRWLLLSLVKMDPNCSTIFGFFSLLALISCPIFLRGVHQRYLDVWIWHISRMVWSCSHQVPFEWHHWCGWSPHSWRPFCSVSGMTWMNSTSLTSFHACIIWIFAAPFSSSYCWTRVRISFSNILWMECSYP